MATRLRVICAERALPYHVHRSVWTALRAHGRWLKLLGRDPRGTLEGHRQDAHPPFAGHGDTHGIAGGSEPWVQDRREVRAGEQPGTAEQAAVAAAAVPTVGRSLST